MKRCTKCGELRPETEYYAAKGTRDGLRGDCKACHAARARDWYAKNREKSIANVARWQRENRERVRAYRRQRNSERRAEIREYTLLRKYGITLDVYDDLLVAQGNGCAICGRPPTDRAPLHVDHDHETGDVRGLLCFRCNGGLGQFSEDEERLLLAATYLGRDDPLHDSARERALALRGG